MKRRSVAEAIRIGAERLAAVSDTARLDAELLMAHVLETPRSELLLRRMHDPAPADFELALEKREGHMPVAYITGSQEFWGLDLAVRPGVLIPRGDSETLVRSAMAARPDARRVLDIGVGSGALLLALLSELPEAEGVGIDASSTACMVAAANVERLGMVGRARVLKRDWAEPGWTGELGRFDLILANPPYVETDAQLAPEVADHEPAEALFAGPEGLDAYRVLVPQLTGLMADNAAAFVEIGASQANAVTAIAESAGFAVVLHRDLGNRPRVLELVPKILESR